MTKLSTRHKNPRKKQTRARQDKTGPTLGLRGRMPGMKSLRLLRAYEGLDEVMLGLTGPLMPVLRNPCREWEG